MKPSVLQHEILHEASDVDDAGYVHVADRGQLFVHPCARPDRTMLDLNRAYVAALAKAGIDGYDKGIRVFLKQCVQLILQIHGMDRLLKRSEDTVRGTRLLGQVCADERAKAISGGTVGANAYNRQRLVRGAYAQMFAAGTDQHRERFRGVVIHLAWWTV
ncbi:recombinational DNA repair protein [Paenibacillus popilliae ATCC 14706]|uniref:Recombinational DNA repair protein n=1 Tax=Paenibacillus popilliae ATCC 14706 TaxID=1212764 RepID=M9LLT2_PAEPP|nr:recombinational DNA repair protein [Paenibacillus popilliae ATCC 14706]